MPPLHQRTQSRSATPLRSQRRKALILVKVISLSDPPDLRAYLRALTNVPVCAAVRSLVVVSLPPSSSPPSSNRRDSYPARFHISTNRIHALCPGESLRKVSTVQDVPTISAICVDRCNVQELRGGPRGGVSPTKVGVSGQAEPRVTRALCARSAGRTSSLVFAPESPIGGYPRPRSRQGKPSCVTTPGQPNQRLHGVGGLPGSRGQAQEGTSHYRGMLAHGLGFQDPDILPSAPSSSSPDLGRGLLGHSQIQN